MHFIFRRMLLSRQSPRWFQKTLRLTLLILIGQQLIALPASAATRTIAVAVEKFDDSNARALVFNGNATVANGIVRLTPAINNQAGSTFWKSRVNLSTSRSFSSYFVISFSDSGGVAPGGADGIVFTLQTQSNTAGGSGSGMGYLGIKPSIGIEFDTWANPSVNDPNDNHVGLDVGGSVVSIATSSALPGTLQDHTWHVWVDYDGSTTNLQVRMSAVNDRQNSSLVLDVMRDLAADIGPDVYVGFTAGTGSAFENQDVQTFYFINDFEPINTNATPSNTYIQTPNQVSAVASLDSISPGDSTIITATVRDLLDRAAPNQTVTFTTDQGTLLTTSGITDANGQVSATLNAGFSGGATTVRASIVGGIYGEATVNIGHRIYMPLCIK